MTQMREHLQRRGEVETFARAGIQPMRDGAQLALGVARQIRAIGQVLAQQASGVLMGPALPVAIRIATEELDRELLGQALVFGHLFAPIVSQPFPQRGRYRS